KMLLAWKAQGIMTLAGYILGFPADTPETIRRDIAIIQHELPVDIIEFFILTPLPGSEDHQKLWKDGAEMEADLNIYDVEHVCTAHPRMTREAWEDIYRETWRLYYTPEHMKILLRRAAATGVPLASLVKLLVSFATMVPLENVHPLQSGLLRLKRPSERRPGMKRVHPLIFWPQFLWETVRKHVALAGTIIRLSAAAYRIFRDPASRVYMDQALTPVGADEEEALELFTKTAGGTAAVAHVKKVAALTHATPASSALRG
ncbi:radical SAM protein, partial [Ensifer sp. BRP08]|nr:radical SAM protein [Ensifer sp. BRP08]